MKAPQGITLQDYGFIEPPPAYEDIVNEQPPRPVPRTNLARSHQVSTSLTSMRDELIPEENVSLSVRQLAQRFQNRPQQAAELPSKPSPPRRLTDRSSFSPNRDQTAGGTTSPARYLSSSRNDLSYTNHNQQQPTAEPPLKPIPPPRPTNIRSISPNREEKTDITTGPNRFSFSPQNVASPPNRQQQAAALPLKLEPVFDSSSTRIYPPCESQRSSNTATALPPKLKPLFDSSSTRSNPSCESEKTSNSATALPMKLKPLFDSSSTRNDSPCESEKTSNPAPALPMKLKPLFDSSSTRNDFPCESEKTSNPAQNYSTGGNTATLSIPTEVVRHVKGKKGNRLETIQGSTGTTIQFIANASNPSITEIKISGTSQGIANAESYVFGLLETAEELREFESVNIARHFLPTIMEWEKLKIIQFFKETTVFFEIRDGKLAVVKLKMKIMESALVYLMSLSTRMRCENPQLFRSQFLKGFSEEDVDNAELKLHEILVQALVNTSTTPFLETYVPESFVGMIIGKEGTKINKLREKTGAKIIITKEDDLNGQRKVRLEGSEEQISAAKAEIDQLIFCAKQYNTRDTLPGKEKLIRIPKSLGGIIVGAGGKTIASMKNNSGAQIVLTNVDFETSVIQICGEPANVAEAERLVFNKLRWNKELKKMPCNSVPAAALSKWRNPKIVEFFSRTGCFLEVTNSDVEIKGFNIDEMFAAEEELQNMVEDASYNKDINMIRDQTAHDLGRLNLNQQKTSRSSTPVLRKMSDDPKRKTAQSKTKKSTPAAPPELNKPKLDCADIALLVNPMLDSWSSDQLIVFQRETCTTINFDYSSLTLEGLCMDDLYDTKNELFQRAKRARERASPRQRD